MKEAAGQKTEEFKEKVGIKKDEAGQKYEEMKEKASEKKEEIKEGAGL